jgi:hypothetical protein
MTARVGRAGGLFGDDHRLAGRDPDLVESTVDRPIRDQEDGDDDQNRQDAIGPTSGLPFVSQVSSLKATLSA